MSRYFHIMNGLRGCYIPDFVHTIRVDTRRELKAYLIGEGTISKRNAAWLAAQVWRKGNVGNYVVPYASGYALQVMQASRSEYMENNHDSFH